MAAHLAVSFLYGNFSAIVQDGRQILSRWTPGADDRSHGWHEGAFRFYLERAIDETGYQGDSVSLVIADVDMEHVRISVPPVKPRARLQLLEKEVERRVDEGRLVWSHRFLGSYRPRAPRPSDEADGGLQGSEHYLVHMWPQHKLRQYLQDLRSVGLSPRLILPVASLMLQWAEEADGLDSVACLVNQTPNGATMMVRNLKGPDVLVRHLTPGVGSGRARLVEEIQRSLLYAKQNLGVNPREARVNAEDLVGDVGARLMGEATVSLAAEWAEPGYPAMRVGLMPRTSTESLVPLSVRNERRNRIIDRVGNYAVTALGVTSLMIAGGVEWYLRGAVDSGGDSTARYELRSSELVQVEREIDQLRQKREFLEWARVQRQPLMTWLVTDLGRMTPAQMRLQKITVEPAEDRFVELSIEASLTTTELESAERSLRQFGEALTAEPWHAVLPEQWMQLWRAQYLRGKIDSEGQELALELTGKLPW